MVIDILVSKFACVCSTIYGYLSIHAYVQMFLLIDLCIPLYGCVITCVCAHRANRYLS